MGPYLVFCSLALFNYKYVSDVWLEKIIITVRLDAFDVVFGETAN